MTGPDIPILSEGDLSIFGLRGSVIVVTGAGSGIGRATAQVLARAGASLVLGDIDLASAEATAALVRQYACVAIAVEADCRSPEALERLADRAEMQGPIRGWCNVAGIVAHAPVIETHAADYAHVLDVNLGGTFWGSAAAAKRMAAHKRGAIVNVSSNAADEPLRGLALYAMSKAAVNMLTRTLALELGPSGIRVNAVAPGFTVTSMTTGHHADVNALVERNAARSPLGRVGSPEDIAFAILYLLSDASRFVTGQILRVNGGVTMP
ncbi:MAG: SDR family oxidoreductase [Sphingobium sp.]|nr:SDR family oxidoreductase [Sphingobium sp.]